MSLFDFIYRKFPFRGFSKTPSSNQPVPPFKKIPKHIAIIMDGNGRWARRRSLPRIAGHRVGVDVLKETLKACSDLGVGYLTVYAFSTENWRRPDEEVNFLMQYMQESLDREIDELDANGVRLRFLGRIDQLSSRVSQKIKEVMQRTEKNNRITFSIMFNYGGRAEILDAASRLVKKALTNGRGEAPVTEQEFQSCLYTSGYPDPDLLIRTGGEERVSNYLLWQLAYAELWFTSVLWPDFNRETLFQAIRDYEKRERRFGDVQTK